MNNKDSFGESYLHRIPFLHGPISIRLRWAYQLPKLDHQTERGERERLEEVERKNGAINLVQKLLMVCGGLLWQLLIEIDLCVCVKRIDK